MYIAIEYNEVNYEEEKKSCEGHHHGINEIKMTHHEHGENEMVKIKVKL